MKGDLNREAADLSRLLSMFGAKRREYAARGIFSMVSASAAALLVVLVMFDGLFHSWRFAPIAIFAVFWGGVAAAAAAACAGSRAILESKKALAGRLGRATGRGSLFSSALEFTGDDERFAAYSPFLMGETVRRAVRDLEGLPASGLFRDHGRPGWLAAGILFTAILVMQIMTGQESFRRVQRAIVDPRAGLAARPGVNLVAICRERTVIAGSDLVARALSMGSGGGEVRIKYSTVPGVWRSEILAPDTLSARGAGGVYSHTFRDVREGFTYMFEAGKERTGACAVEVIHRPVINRVSARLEYPAYTRAEPETIETLSGAMAALAGTRVHLQGETSRDIKGGELVFSSGRKVALEPQKSGFRCTFTVTADDTFGISVVDHGALSNESTLRYPVVRLEDRAPSIEVLSPADESTLPRSLAAEIVYRAFDDYGLSSIDLLYMKEGRDSGFSAVPPGRRTSRPERAVEETFEWSLEGDRVLPGDRILYYLEARDGNTAPGAGYSRTGTRVLIVPSLADIYAEARREEEYRREDMEEILEESGRIRDRLSEMAEDMRAEGEMDWNSRREGGEILEAQNELQRKIGETADRLGEALRAMEQNRMTSMEIGRKMEQIQEMLAQIENGQLRDLMERFREMMNSVPESDMAAAMEQIEMSAEEMTERLDRTIELLEQLMREQKMEELVRRMEEMMDKQSALRDSTAAGDLDELSGEQERLEEEYGDFENSMEDFARENSDAVREAQAAVERMNETLIDSLMRSAASQMEAHKRDEASGTQNETVRRMLSLFTEMGKCQMAMSAKSDARALMAMEKAAKDLIDISILYERTLPGLAAGDAPARMDDLLGEQLVAREAVRKVIVDLAEAARASMSVPQAALSRLAVAMRMIDASVEAMENRSFQSASMAGRLVPAHINMAAMELLKSMSSSGGGGSGSSEQMSLMLQRQNSIDEQLRRMFGQGGEGSNSMEARARMARIAAEQRKQRELMEQIAGESRGSGELLGRIDDIGDEMREVAERLERGELDKELMEREERILSRMLESQRSLERRDFKRERISRTAGDVRAREGAFTGEEQSEADILLEKIRRGMQDKGPAEYEELIRAYFRALSGKVREND